MLEVMLLIHSINVLHHTPKAAVKLHLSSSRKHITVVAIGLSLKPFYQGRKSGSAGKIFVRSAGYAILESA